MLARPADTAPGKLVSTLEGGIPATVPGCVHTDLMAAGLIDDPYAYGVEPALLWIGRSDWAYAASFEADADLRARRRVELCFDGLDTVATVELNGQRLGETANMHRRYRFDATEALREGGNALTVRFAAPLEQAEKAEAFYGYLPHNGHGGNTVQPPHNMLRKMPCNFGWDWGPVLTTCGIWRDVRLEAWDEARLGDVRPGVIHADESRATLSVDVVVATAVAHQGEAACRVQVEAFDPEGQAVAAAEAQVGDADSATLSLDIDRPRRWWPAGYGDQPRYRLDLKLRSAQGDELDRASHHIGIRTVELDTSADDQPGRGAAVDGLPTGEAMTVKVNGVPVFLKGANWIPDDCFPTRSESRDRLAARIDQALAANMNTLRVWGGGVYAAHDFMELCDERGLLVWHDFMLACAAYPEEEPYRSEVEAEARDNVSRLARHPSLAIWNGCNENIWGTFDWGHEWEQLRTQSERTWGLGYYLDLLPSVVSELAPTVPYWPASPYSGSMDRHPNANAYGNRHVWNVWHGDGQYRNYLGHFPRLSSEFGYHGPPCYATLDRVLPDTTAARRWNSEAMEFFNRNGGRGGQSHTHLRLSDDFDPPEDDLDAWLFLAQVMQARALAMGCSWFRALWPWCAGATYWQLNDCWPVSSWSAIDGDGRPKPLWFASRRFFAPRLLTIKPSRPVADGDDAPPLAGFFHNDTDQPWSGPIRLRRVSLEGYTLDETTHPVDAPARRVTRLDIPADWHDRPEDTALLIDTAEARDNPDTPATPVRGWWWFAPDKRLAYAAPNFDTDLQPCDGGYRLTLEAQTLLRDVYVFPDRLDPAASASDNGFTLLPGESASIKIRTDRQLTLQELGRAPVLRCVNDFGRSS